MSTTIQEWTNGQKSTTIPKTICDLFKLKAGDKIDWIFDRGDLIIRKV